MIPNSLPAFLQRITASVTPVVMLSACSTLILGINAKHSGVADRLRAATAEYRTAPMPSPRREQLRRQILVFHRRFYYTWLSLVLLYGAVVSFILTTLVIVLSENRIQMNGMAPIGLFIAGVSLMLSAGSFELLEVWLAVKTMRYEVEDVLAEPPPREHGG